MIRRNGRLHHHDLRILRSQFHRDSEDGRIAVTGRGGTVHGGNRRPRRTSRAASNPRSSGRFRGAIAGSQLAAVQAADGSCWGPNRIRRCRQKGTRFSSGKWRRQGAAANAGATCAQAFSGKGAVPPGVRGRGRCDRRCPAYAPGRRVCSGGGTAPAHGVLLRPGFGVFQT